MSTKEILIEGRTADFWGGTLDKESLVGFVGHEKGL